MQLSKRRTPIVLAAAAVFFLPVAARSADAPSPSAAITVTAARALGAEAVTITGNAPSGGSVEAALYARFSQDLPTVLLSRRPILADANGHYAATLPIASAFFRNAIITVVVGSLPAGASARTSFTVGAPNVPAPPDDVPTSVR